MKAAVCREFGQPLVIEDLSLSEPHAGELTVRIVACAICHSDILYLEGAWGGVLPAVYGHEAAGVVEQVGPGVTRVKPGDHVVVTLIRSCGQCYFCSRGEQHLCEAEFELAERTALGDANGNRVTQGLRTAAFAEYVLVDASQVVAVPADLPLASASLLACGVITGYCAVTNTAAIGAGTKVVVIGTGGVGLNSVQGAALSNAAVTIALDLSNTKLAAARRFGATHTVNPSRDDPLSTVLELTDGRGADYVFVTVGSASALQQGLELLRTGGTLVMVGMTPIGVKAEIETLNLADRAQRILGSKMGSARLRVDIPALVDLYQQGRLQLDELITGQYPLAEINAAIASVKRGDALRNVIVF